MAFTPSQKPTREWPLLVLAVALVGAVCVPLYQWTVADQAVAASLTKWSPERIARLLLGPEQIACYCAAAWAALILFGRHLEARRQRRAFRLELLPPDVCILPEDARLLQRRIDQQVGRGGPYMLSNLLKLALGKYAVSRSGREASETVRTQADLDMSRLVSTMSMVHYLAWAIPAIGFLGTVRGLAGSLTLGGETKMELANFIKEATGHLNVAFDCTLVALALSLVVMPHRRLAPTAEVAVFDDRFFTSLGGYSELLVRPAFYEAFAAYRFMLIYQLDAFVFQDQLLEWCGRDWDYIGAPWREDSGRWMGVGNGGFCLRKVGACLDVLHSRHKLDPHALRWGLLGPFPRRETDAHSSAAVHRGQR